MNKTEAKQIANKELETYRVLSYSDLLKMIGNEPICYQLTSQNKIKYQIEIQVFWDNKPNGNIRVIASIDDGGRRAFAPIASDFIKDKNNKFVGE